MEKLNIKRKKTKKTQILLYDTQRRVEDFLNKIKYRNGGQYEDIPHFVVSKLGVVHEIFDTDYSSKTFDNPDVDKRIIKIALENLGWLNKNTITGVLNNWIGDPYRSEPHIKSWRNYFFWDKYTDVQLETTHQLCESLCKKHNIPEKMVSSNGYFERSYKFKGIVCKSNYSDIYTDINPSFNFNYFLKNAEQNEHRL
jgi:hypothetical protein